MAPSRRKFVNTGKINKATKQITEANATQSPFFSQLSPEIRNRIYELVLGGYHLHIRNYDKDQSSVYPCEAEQTDVDYARSITEGILQQEPPSPFARHKKCTGAKISRRSTSRTAASVESRTDGQLNLGLLLVSRQVHQEAALIPFTKNTFLVSVYGRPMSFVRELLTRPHHALSNLVIDQAYWIDAKRSIAPVILPRLPGLKRVTITMEVRVFKKYGPEPSLPGFEKSLKGIKGALHGRNLIRLNIAVVEGYDEGVNRDLSQSLMEPYRATARETEKAILQSRDEKS